MSGNYNEFLHSKIVTAPVGGLEIDPAELSTVLKPHQRDAVIWAVRGGRRALFESFGLGKTAQELEYCRLVVKHEGGQAIIVLPLGVRQEFTRDGLMEEMADVSIMLNQLELIFGDPTEEEIAKLERLERLVQNA